MNKTDEARVENSTPKLNSYKIERRSHQAYILFEGNPQPILVSEWSLDVINLMNGSNRISEIIQVINDKNGGFKFGQFLHLLKQISSSNGFQKTILDLEKLGNHLEISEPKVNRLLQPFFRKKLFGNEQNIKSPEQAQQALLAILGTGVGIAGIWSIFSFLIFDADLAFTNFVRLGAPIWLLPLVFYGLISAILTIKTILNWVLLAATDTPSQVSFVIGLFYAGLDLDDTITYRHLSTAASWGSYLTNTFSTPLLIGLLRQQFPSFPLIDSAFVLSLGLIIIDGDPYVRSSFASFFERVTGGQMSRDLMSYLRKKSFLAVVNKKILSKDVNRWLWYSTYSTIWMTASVLFMMSLVNRALPNLLVYILLGSTTDRFGGVLVLAGFSVVYFYLVSDVVSLVFSNLFEPFRIELKRRMISKKQQSKAFFTVAEFVKLAKKIALFEDSTEEFLKSIYEGFRVLTVGAGYPLIIQGKVGKEFFLLVDGVVEIRVRDEAGLEQVVANLGAPNVFGEVALLDNKLRTADVVAVGEVTVLIADENVMKKVSANSSEPSWQKIREHLMLQQAMSASPLFAGLPDEVVERFRNAGKIRSIAKGETVFNEGDSSGSFYFVVRGFLEASSGNLKVAEFSEGGFFGEIAALSGARRTATLKANVDSIVFELSKANLWTVLAVDLNLGMYIEIVAEARMSDLAERKKVTA